MVIFSGYKNSMCSGLNLHSGVFINIVSRRATGFHRMAKLFEHPELLIFKENFPSDVCSIHVLFFAANI